MESRIGLGGACMVMGVISMVGEIELGDTKQRKGMWKSSSLLLLLLLMMMKGSTFSALWKTTILLPITSSLMELIS